VFDVIAVAAFRDGKAAGRAAEATTVGGMATPPEKLANLTSSRIPATCR
jgi:hypothetical protein